MPAGGPYELTVTDSQGTHTATDIYLGDIWVCVGQSNMMFPMTKMHKAATWEPATGDNFRWFADRARTAGSRQPASTSLKTGQALRTILANTSTKNSVSPSASRLLEQAAHRSGSGRQPKHTKALNWRPSSSHARPRAISTKTESCQTKFARTPIHRPKASAATATPTSRKRAMPTLASLKLKPGPARRRHVASSFGRARTMSASPPTTSRCSAPYHALPRKCRTRVPLLLYSAPHLQRQAWRSHQDGRHRRPTRCTAPRGMHQDPTVEMVVTYDIYSRGIHPSKKQEYGIRLANAVLGKVYEKTSLMHAKFRPHRTKGHNTLVHFKDVGAGLRTSDGKPPIDFTIAGKDQAFHPATAKIVDNDTIALQSSVVSAPIAVRYAWQNSPKTNLIGDGNLPSLTISIRPVGTSIQSSSPIAR